MRGSSAPFKLIEGDAVLVELSASLLGGMAPFCDTPRMDFSSMSQMLADVLEIACANGRPHFAPDSNSLGAAVLRRVTREPRYLDADLHLSL